MSAKLRVLVLGAGFGGLETAARLSEGAADRVEVTLLDESDGFSFGFAKLDAMFGRTPHVLRTPYASLDRPGVTFRQERVLRIDPERRVVQTDAGTHGADVLVVALGAALDPGATPGLEQGGFEFYSVAGAERAAAAIRDFPGGQVVIGVAGAPYKCPPAPSETALMLHDFLSRRGRAGASEITIVSPLPTPVPPSPPTAHALLEAFAERGITFRGASRMVEVRPDVGRVVLDDGSELDYDLLLGVPRHHAPEVCGSLAVGNDGWVHVDPFTLRTPHPNVFALGDVADAPVPRAGVFAERAAAVVAEQILGMVDDREVAPYDGYGSCFIDFGDDRVAKVEITFMTDQGVQGGPFLPPSVELGREKQEFGPTRIGRWFGPHAVESAV
jgi:sulfide:quinone oxidoreductase